MSLAAIGTTQAAFVLSAVVLVGCDVQSSGFTGSDASEESARKDLTVLLDSGYSGSWPTGLDPATNTTARANLSQMNAIFGGLFQLRADDDGSDARIVGVLASGYEIERGGRTIVISLRRNLVFSDGTPLTAEDVQFNIERNLDSSCSCSPTGWPWAAEDSVVVRDAHTIALRFSRPYGAAINAFPTSNINWIASPAALSEKGEDEFRIAPVGAGPFRVVSNQLSSRLVLERNPLYWEEGRPHLDRLVFQSIGGEHAALQAILSGDADVYEGMVSTRLIEQARKDDRLVATQQPPTTAYVIQLNTSREPFDDKRVREAIYYATNVQAIRAGLFNSWYPASQSFTGPGGLFHRERVAGYRSFDLDKAKALVREAGAVEVDLGTVRTFVAEQVVTALQSQWQAAGISVTTESHELPSLIQKYRSGDWQAMLQTAGSYDPEAGAGVRFRFRSDQRYTGVRDPELDAILDAAAAALDPAERDALYEQAALRISDEAYAPFLFAFAPTQVVRRGVHGPGLTTRIPAIAVNTGVIWQEVRSSREP